MSWNLFRRRREEEPHYVFLRARKFKKGENKMGANRNWQKAPNDNYQEWLLKSIPSETIGLYLGIHAFLIQWQGRPDAVMWVFLAICVAATPFFLYKGGIKRPTQYIIATLAVPIWAMSIPESAWWTLSGWQPWIGGLVVLLYVVLLAPLIAFAAVRFED